MEKKGFDKIELRRFARNTFIALVVYGSILLICRHKNYVWFYLAAAVVVLLYFIIPGLLNLIYFIAKKIVFLIGWVAGHLVLLLFFYVIFTPVGLAIRIFGIDLLNRKIRREKRSYWKEEEEKGFRPVSYQRQL